MTPMNTGNSPERIHWSSKDNFRRIGIMAATDQQTLSGAQSTRPMLHTAPSTRAEAHRVVIVGGGVGGLGLATRLSETLGRAGHARIVLVDRWPTHFWKP